MSNPAAKALRDKLSHLKSGRDSHNPVQDKTKIKDIKMPSMPGMKAPRAPAMAKSDDPMDDNMSSPVAGMNTPTAPVMNKEEPKKDDKYGDLFKAFDSWQKKEDSYKNINFTKSQEPLMKPFKSDAQRRAMYAAAEGESNIGIPKKVGKEFVSDSKSQDQSKLPEKVEKSDNSSMCKSEDLKSMLHCLCHDCRHNSGLMERLKIRCACDYCCVDNSNENEALFEKSSDQHPETCRCEPCRELLKKKNK